MGGPAPIDLPSLFGPQAGRTIGRPWADTSYDDVGVHDSSDPLKEIEELPLWGAVTAHRRRKARGRAPDLRNVFKRTVDYRQLVKRLPAAGLLSEDPKLLSRVARVP